MASGRLGSQQPGQRVRSERQQGGETTVRWISVRGAVRRGTAAYVRGFAQPGAIANAILAPAVESRTAILHAPVFRIREHGGRWLHRAHRHGDDGEHDEPTERHLLAALRQPRRERRVVDGVRRFDDSRIPSHCLEQIETVVIAERPKYALATVVEGTYLPVPLAWRDLLDGDVGRPLSVPESPKKQLRRNRLAAVYQVLQTAVGAFADNRQSEAHVQEVSQFEELVPRRARGGDTEPEDPASTEKHVRN